MFFKKKKIILIAPITGKYIKLENVPDEAFSQKMLGDGIAIEPTNGEVFSPIDGEVFMIPDSKHAIGIKHKDIEILIHFGIDTVSLNGEGFKTLVKVGDQIKSGDLLFKVDLKLIKEKVPSIITPVIICNLGERKLEILVSENQSLIAKTTPIYEIN